MRAIISGIALLVISILLPACSDDGTMTGVGPVPAGLYHYTAYDSTGVTVVKGIFSIKYQDSTKLTGEWKFNKIGNPENIGPQVGSGSLIGGIDSNRVWIELQPEFRDNNLELVGHFENEHIRGDWIWISFVGITSRGTFDAERR